MFALVYVSETKAQYQGQIEQSHQSGGYSSGASDYGRAYEAQMEYYRNLDRQRQRATPKPSVPPTKKAVARKNQIAAKLPRVGPETFFLDNVQYCLGTIPPPCFSKVKVNGAAWNMGIRPGDRLIRVNNIDYEHMPKVFPRHLNALNEASFTPGTIVIQRNGRNSRPLPIMWGFNWIQQR